MNIPESSFSERQELFHEELDLLDAYIALHSMLQNAAVLPHLGASGPVKDVAKMLGQWDRETHDLWETTFHAPDQKKRSLLRVLRLRYDNLMAVIHAHVERAQSGRHF